MFNVVRTFAKSTQCWKTENSFTTCTYLQNHETWTSWCCFIQWNDSRRSIQSLKIKTFFIDRSGLLEIVIELSWREIDFFAIFHSPLWALNEQVKEGENFFHIFWLSIVIWIMNSANFSRYREYWMLKWAKSRRSFVGKIELTTLAFDLPVEWTSFKSIEPWKWIFHWVEKVAGCYFGLIGCRWAQFYQKWGSDWDSIEFSTQESKEHKIEIFTISSMQRDDIESTNFSNRIMTMLSCCM